MYPNIAPESLSFYQALSFVGIAVFVIGFIFLWFAKKPKKRDW
jgi:hypothetical protein